MTTYLETVSVPKRVFRTLATCLALFLLFEFASLYLSWPKQIALGIFSIGVALVLNRRSKSQIVTIALMLLSVVTTLRYVWWRIHLIADFFSDESNHHITISAVLMLILLSAEAYTILIMALGYIQTVAPLHRKPIPLPTDLARWPHVDVLIPTYNEPLTLVRYTALAAIYMDYPPEKLHVYILDDGTREDFRLFCKDADIGYIVREEHEHAKAGNINHALTQMHSSLVTIFDCDHVPTRSFLEETVGWFLADEKLAMLQTPHFFYSPDPFERNLLYYKTIPNEGELFYGVIQDGNDLWNATFFCGSCAVLRRAALDDVGGVATETVTEDAHTSLRMQKRGWDTAYINIPQAAGLATGTLTALVGQRIRWARGMIQILRTENPLFAWRMKLTQRLCYFNAMLHFLYAGPRLVFLCAPLAYIFFRWTILPGYWLAILAYAMPHLIISSLTNSRVQSRYRHSFWNEIYETVLAPYILAPTLLALIHPTFGTFNVTDKESTFEETSYDRHIATPTILLLALNFLGICMVPYRLLVTDPTHPGTILSNLAWILFNMVILGVAAAVANEHRQRRTTVRVPADLVVQLRGDDGTTISAETIDISIGGMSLALSAIPTLTSGSHFRISFPEQTGAGEIGATVLGPYGPSMRLKFDLLTIPEQETLTRAIFSRADAWITPPGKIEEDRPLVSFARVVRLSFTGFHQVLRGLLPRKRNPLVLPLSLLLIALSVPAAAALPVNPTKSLSESNATDKITLKDMGVNSSIALHGPHSYNSVGFVLSNDRIPRAAVLNLTYHFSSAILPHTGSIKVILNGTLIGTIEAPAVPYAGAQYDFLSLPIPSDSLVRHNQITFEFTGNTVLQVNPQAAPATLANIGATSTVLIRGDHVPMLRDLSLLPLPFFDNELQTSTTIPFVFLTTPTRKTLQAAAMVASWFGMQVTTKPIRFSVATETIPRGNIVVFANNISGLPSSVRVPSTGASLSVVANPSDSDGTALILAGEDDDQLLTAARRLSLLASPHRLPSETAPLLGSMSRIEDFPLPGPRKPDDAPRWMTANSLQPMWTDTTQAASGTDGQAPVPLYFRLPPDLYYGETQNITLNLSYRYNALPLAEGSTLRVYINGWLAPEVPLAPGRDYADRKRAIPLPAEMMRPFSNTFLINFNFVPLNRKDGGNNPARALHGDILRASSIDLRGLAHWAAMPNLELFANAGFPFTRMADLSETVIVMPLAPTSKEIAVMLTLLGHFGEQTGYPSLAVEIAAPDTVMRNDRDYLILGDVGNQPAFTALEGSLPAVIDANGIHAKRTTSTLSWLQSQWKQLRGGPVEDLAPTNANGLPDLMIEGIESPTFAGRSIVLVALRYDDAADKFADVFLERSQSGDIAQSVSILQKNLFTSYRLETPAYHIGYLSKYALMRIWLAQHTWLLLAAVTAFCLLLAGWIREYILFTSAARLQAATKTL